MTGVRIINGREFHLAGRGTKGQCQREVVSFRKQWHYVRILPYGYGQFGRTIDDYGIWVNSPKGENQ